MTKDTFKNTISRYADITDRVALTGGEPCLSPFFIEFVSALYNSGKAISINTSGQLLQDRYLEFLGIFRPTVYLSLDSVIVHQLGPRGISQIHVRHLAEQSRSKSIAIVIVATVSKSTLNTLYYLVNWCLRNGFPIHIQPIYLPESHPLFHTESLTTATDSEWNIVIDKIHGISPRLSRILRTWYAIFRSRHPMPTPQSCSSLRDYIIISPEGTKLKCFCELFMPKLNLFPKCFGQHCLFCWHQDDMVELAPSGNYK